MIFHLVLICFVLRFDARSLAEDRFQSSDAREIDATRYCDFDGTRNNYGAADLVQCLEWLIGDLVDQDNGGQAAKKNQWNGSTGRQMSFMDIFASLLDQGQSPPHQTAASFPPDTTSGYYQSNYPAIPSGMFDLPAGFRLDLLDALSTISSHDHYKCVARILCEMASGKLPGRSLSKQTSSNFFDFLGKNAFMEWLTNIDVAGHSPFLNFGRAMVLGYSNRGNSVACFRAFPKCPKDPGQLIYYLNNYNGGFFRLFNRIRIGRRGEFDRLRERRRDHPAINAQGRIITASWIDADAPSGFGSEIQFPINADFKNNNEIVFPDERFPRSEFATNDIPNYVPTSEENVWHSDRVPFFPQVSHGKRYSRLRFP
ncbi:uncharacterized protein LOC117217787 [Megalopta genalis]|uniref:uncharacterized protein LOC117217787 n=1 Tax=Megalopta genalis TaxID=115081 RepID=UPI003FCF058F